MRRPRPLVGAIAILIAGLFGASCNIAIAQDTEVTTMPSDIIAATGPLTADQTQTVEQFTAYWLDVLRTGSPNDKDKARRKLRSTSTAADQNAEFRKRYNAILLSQIAASLKAPEIPAEASKEERQRLTTEHLLFRINAMWVILKVSGENILPVIEVGLTDENGAVRYWAAKAAAEMATRKAFVESEELGVLKLLEKALGLETQSAALAEQLKALNAMKIAEARAVLMNVLSARISVHAENPALHYLPELNALQDMYRRVISDYANNRAGVIQQINDLTSISYRYMRLVTMQLESEETADAATSNDRPSMIEQCDSILRFAVTNLAPGERQPEEITSALKRADWNFILVQIDRWERILKKGPFAMTPDQLKVEIPEAE
ncbi:hypothetical protein [Poriferisphaera sp. WC338]|uniref:hypothetical protein n=1 Tax=Poriferisphaera sp. WC338 TaxID=3425129 RepID=UPI003D81A99A